MSITKKTCSCCSDNDDHDHDHSHEGHDHDHQHDEDTSKNELYLLIFCSILFFAIMAGEERLETSLGVWGVRIAYAIPYLLCGIPIMKEALAILRKGNIFNEFTLMCGATIAAICLNQLAEAVGVMLFYRIGEYVQAKAAGSSRRSIKSLLASRPTTANILENGIETATSVENVTVGQTVVVRAGEKIPLDGTILTGSSDIDQSPLTGESLPVQVQEGAAVLGGSINLSGSLTIRVDSAFADTHMARILEMVEHAATRKSPTERFISRFARYYTPAVVFLAVLVAILPPLLVADATFDTWVYRALVLLVISCPCALLISIPLGYFGGIGSASRKGILVKGGNVMDDLLRVTTVVFDKTGTLTKGNFSVADILPAQGIKEEQLLRAAIIAEFRASHPIAKAIMQYAEQKNLSAFIAELSSESASLITTNEIAGKGITVTKGNSRYIAGTATLMAEKGLTPAKENRPGAVVHIAENGVYLGHFFVADEIKPDTKKAINALKSLGFTTIMLTGDREETAQLVAQEIGIDTYKAGLLPEGKVAAVDTLDERENIAFVGDGINDAPLLVRSRVGIAMGGIGSEAAIEAADAVILNDSLENVVKLFGMAKEVRTIVIQNVTMALGTKLFVMGFGILGLSGLWEAIFADVGVALLAVLNSSRIMRK